MGKYNAEFIFESTPDKRLNVGLSGHEISYGHDEIKMKINGHLFRMARYEHGNTDRKKEFEERKNITKEIVSILKNL